MRAINSPFSKIINGTTQFKIPVFQRDYTWTEQQCKQLWKDILRASKVDKERGHFLGSIVYVATGDSAAAFTRWLLIDGQQRLTTLTILLAALRDHIAESNWSGGKDAPTSKRIDAYFLRNLQEEGDRERKLVLRRHDDETLRAIVQNTEQTENPSERIIENYEFFREKIKSADPTEVYKGIDRLVVVDVSLDRTTDDPQLIFESLNSTGVDLSQSDLIRNYILMRLPENEQTTLYENYWHKIEDLFRSSETVFDNFARDYVALKTQSTKQEKAGEIYNAFREQYEKFVKANGSIENTLADILTFARYYEAFALGRGKKTELSRYLAAVRRLVDVPALLIMRLHDAFEEIGGARVAEFSEALELIESYVLRRAVCGLQTRGYWQVFAGLAYKIGDEDPLTDLKVSLARLRENYRFPSDEEFLRHLIDADIYGLRVCRHLLERLENYKTKEPSDTSEYSIEHIMPQNEKLNKDWRDMLGDNWKEIQSQWLHRLGNLTLTGYNSKYSDRPFADKKSISGGFSESSVRLNKFVREQDNWTEAEISKRNKQLAKQCLKVWRPLVVDEDLVAAARNAEKRERAKKSDFSKVKMTKKSRELFDSLDEKILALDESVFAMAETSSVSYHAPSFFMEVIPRKHKLSVLLDLDFGEVSDPSGIAEDATQWKFLVNATYEGGVTLSVDDQDSLRNAIPIIRQAFTLARDGT